MTSLHLYDCRWMQENWEEHILGCNVVTWWRLRPMNNEGEERRRNSEEENQAQNDKKIKDWRICAHIFEILYVCAYIKKLIFYYLQSNQKKKRGSLTILFSSSGRSLPCKANVMGPSCVCGVALGLLSSGTLWWGKVLFYTRLSYSFSILKIHSTCLSRGKEQGQGEHNNLSKSDNEGPSSVLAKKE